MRPFVRALVVLACVTMGCTSGDSGSNSSFASGVSIGSTAPGTATSETAGNESGEGGTSSSSSGGADTATSIDPTTTTTTGAVDGGSSGDTGAACPALGGQDCSPGNGSGKGDTCTDPGSCFIDLVQSGVQGVIAAHPDWFDAVDTTLVLTDYVESYMNAVVDDVNAQGVCAIRDPNAGDEIAVKHDNAFAESFDILTADGHARYGELIYTATCAPAWF